MHVAGIIFVLFNFAGLWKRWAMNRSFSQWEQWVIPVWLPLALLYKNQTGRYEHSKPFETPVPAMWQLTKMVVRSEALSNFYLHHIFLWFIYCSLWHHVCKQGVDFQVFSLDGDGAVLMHMGALATIAQRKVPNFRHIVFNNGAHDSVGGQPTEARHFDDFSIPGIAMACGYKEVRKIQTS